MSQTSPTKPQVLLTHFEWNLQRLSEVLQQDQTEYFKGAALQRFGHTYDMSLQNIRAFADLKSQPCNTDEQCFETAALNGWIGPGWKDLADDYQKITQKPQQDADLVYGKLESYYLAFNYLFTQLKAIT